MSCAMALSGKKATVLSAALPHGFLPHGQRESQLTQLGLSAEHLADMAIRQWFDKK